MRRRVLLVCLVVLTLAFAGCAEDVPAGTELDTDGGDSLDATEDTEASGDTDDSDGATNGEQTPDGETLAPANGTLEIHHIDVGQADSTLVVTPTGETVLVDSGGWQADGQEVIDYLETHDVERIDHLVATHPHADHIGGHAAVIEHYETERDGVGAAYDSGVAHTSQTYENYLDAIETHDVDLFTVEDGDAIPLADDAVRATVLNPPAGESGEGLHDNSVSLAIEFGQFSYVTTGDAEQSVESRLLDQRSDALDADLYQAGHHGSSTSSSTRFLDAVDPDVAVISSNLDSQYGHPHDEVLQRLAERDVETYWTGVHGDVVVTTDGANVTVTTEQAATTDPAALLDLKQNGAENRPWRPAHAAARTQMSLSHA